MARLFPLLILLALLVVAIVARQHVRPRSDRVYRPRASPFGRRPPDAGGDANWVASRADAEGLRDAYSSESIDPDRVLYRCGGCQACSAAARECGPLRALRQRRPARSPHRLTE